MSPPPSEAPAAINAPASLQRSAVRGFAWLSALNVGRAIIRLAVLAILGHLLLPRDFGLVAAAGTVLWFANIFSSLGVGPAIVQRPTLEVRHIHTGFVTTLVFGLLFAVLAVVLAPWIASLFHIPAVATVLRVMAVLLPISALAAVGEALLQRGLRFGVIARGELASYIVGYGAVGIPLAWLGYGVWSLVGAEVVKSVCKTTWFLVAAPHSKRLRFDLRACRELLWFGSGYTATSLSMYFALQGDNLVVARALGAGALGLYGRAYELMLLPSKALGDMLHKVLFPTMSKVQRDPRGLRMAYRRGIALAALVVLPASAAMVVLAPEIVRTLLGPRWMDAVAPLRILAIAMYFQIGYMVGQAVAHATGRVYGSAWRSATYAVLVVLGALVGQRWGLAGVAVGVAIAIAVNFVLISQLALSLTRVRLRELAVLHAPPLGVAVATGTTMWATASVLHSVVPAVVVLVAAFAAAALVALALVRFAPRLALGVEGVWLGRTMYDHAPAALRPFVGRMLGPYITS